MKRYLGDSVYVEMGSCGEIILTTNNGDGATNKIFLEPQIINALLQFLQKATDDEKEN